MLVTLFKVVISFIIKFQMQNIAYNLSLFVQHDLNAKEYSEEEAVATYKVMKTVVDKLWDEYNKEKKETIGKCQLKIFLADILEQTISEEVFGSSFAHTEFNQQGEID